MLDLHQLIRPHDDLVSPLSWKKKRLGNNYQKYYWWLSVWICSHGKTMVRHFGKLPAQRHFHGVGFRNLKWLLIHFMYLFWQYWNKWKRMAAFNKCRWTLKLMVRNMQLYGALSYLRCFPESPVWWDRQRRLPTALQQMTLGAERAGTFSVVTLNSKLLLSAHTSSTSADLQQSFSVAGSAAPSNGPKSSFVFFFPTWFSTNMSSPELKEKN